MINEKNKMSEEAATSALLKSVYEAMKVESSLMDKDLSNKTALTEGLPLLVEITIKLSDFGETWNSWKMQELEEIQPNSSAKEIDVSLFNTKKIDFKQMGNLMQRILRGTFYIKHLNSIKRCIAVYRNSCEENNLQQCELTAKKLQGLIDMLIEDIETDNKELKSRLENVNLYNQNFKVSETVKIAYVSLFVSSLAFLLTILQSLKII